MMNIIELKTVLLANEYLKLDECRMREDLAGLMSDMVIEVLKINNTKIALLYRYEYVIKALSDICRAEDAYCAGIAAFDPSLTKDDAYISYYTNLLDSDKYALLTSTKYKLQSEIMFLLGNKSGLFNEYNELYQKCDIEFNNHGLFFKHGYENALQQHEIN